MAQQQSQQHRQQAQRRHHQATEEAGQSEQAEQSEQPEERFFHKQRCGLLRLPLTRGQRKAGRAGATDHHPLSQVEHMACWQEAARFFVASAPYSAFGPLPKRSSGVTARKRLSLPLRRLRLAEESFLRGEVQAWSIADLWRRGPGEIDKVWLIWLSRFSRTSQIQTALRKKPLVCGMLASTDQKAATASFLLAQASAPVRPHSGRLEHYKRQSLDRPFAIEMAAWSASKPEHERRTSLTLRCVRWTKSVPLLATRPAGRASLPLHKRPRHWRAAWLAGAKRFSRRQAC